MTALDFRATISTEKLSATRLADRIGRRARTYGMDPRPDAKLILLGSTPVSSDAAMVAGPLSALKGGKQMKVPQFDRKA